MKPSLETNGGSGGPVAPIVLWAQRADQLLLTIEIEDCKNPTINLEKDRLHFKGKSDSIQSGHEHKEYEVTLDFHCPIKVDDSKHVVKARGIEFTIIKEEAKWWPRLLKDSTKRHWLKIDFPKWKDEDDSEDEMMGGAGMGGMGGGFGAGGADFGDFMQQFGGMAGAGGGPGEEDDEEGDESDDDDTEQAPPDLE